MTDAPLDAETQKKLDDALSILGKDGHRGVLLLDDKKELTDAGARYVHERLTQTPPDVDRGAPLVQNLEMLTMDGSQLSDTGRALMLDIVQKASNLRTVHFLGHRFPPEQQENLHEALTNRPPLQTIIFRNCDLGEKPASRLGDLMNAMRDDTFFGVMDCGLEGADFHALAESVKTAQLSGINLKSDHLTGDALQSVTDAIKENTNIHRLTLSAPQMGPAGAEPLDDLITHAPHLHELNIWDTPLGETGRQKLADSVGKNTSLREFTYAMPQEKPKAKKEFFTAILEKNRQLIGIASEYNDMFFTSEELNGLLERSPNPNLENIFRTFMHPVGEANAARAKKLLVTLHYELENQLERLTPQQLSQLDERRNLAFHMAETRFNEQSLDLPTRQDFEAFMATLPGVPDVAEGWFTPDEKGFAPLDNPRLWKDAESARKSMNEAPLTTDFLSASTAHGTTFLAALLNALPATEVLEGLNARGVKLGAKELLQENGTPNELFGQFIGKPDGVKAIFRDDNWVGKHAREASAVFDALPDDRKDVPITSLRVKLASSSRSAGIGR